MFFKDYPSIKPVTGDISWSNRWDHFKARVGIRRNSHSVEPGLYTIGSPSQDSPVFVSANYTLSFDSLRSALNEQDGYILVLDTKGINVWCAAGKGTFGTDELVHRIEQSKLLEIVNHRKVIVPQLGAPGIAAHEVKKRSGFIVRYGPARAKDLPEYLKNRKATEKMRRVKFTLTDRLLLIPIEINHMILPTIIIAILFYFLGGILWTIGVTVALIAGVVLFPILLPWIPTANFSTKGFILGGLLAIPFAFINFFGSETTILWQRIGWALSFLLLMPSITAFLTLNFTGSTTFTSRSGVRKEIFTYISVMAWMFGVGLLISIILRIV